MAAERAPLSEDELKLIRADSHKVKVVSDGEAYIIARVLEFADKQAESVMIAAGQVSRISLARTLKQKLTTATEHLDVRLPLCCDEIDSVIGTVSMKGRLAVAPT